MNFAALLTTVDRGVQRHLGDDVTYTSGSGVVVQVRGVFDRVYVPVDVGTAGVSSSGPTVFLMLADLPSNPADDLDARVTSDGQTYSVNEAEVDGKGGVRLLLHVVP